MIDDLARQLQDPDPAVRRQAITALANSRDPAALKPLAIAYQRDPDPALRELALKAGRYIRQYEAQQQAAESQAGDTGAEPVISARDRELAKNYLDSASGFYTGGDRPRAVEHLGKALSLDPDLAKDSFTINLILMATGRPLEDALPILTHPDRREAFIERLGGKRKLKRSQEHGKGAETATWDNVMLDFGIYWVVGAVVIALIFILTIDTIREIYENMPSSATTSTIDWNSFWAASIAVMVVVALVYSLFNAIALAIQGAAIHVAAIYILAGNGTLVYLFRRLVPFQTVVTIAMGTVYVLLAVSGSGVGVWFLIPLVLAGGSVAVGYYMAKLVGEVYAFGAGSGCAAIVLGGVLLAALWCGANYAMFYALGLLLG